MKATKKKPSVKKEASKKTLQDNLSDLDLSNSDALFVSCTALPVLEIIEKLEKKINKIVMSSNQTLIWETLRSVGYNKSIDGYGKLLRS